MLNASGIDLCYKDIHSKRVNYTEQRLIPDYIELTSRRINSEQSSNHKNFGRNSINLCSLQPTPNQTTRENMIENSNIKRSSHIKDSFRSPSLPKEQNKFNKQKNIIKISSFVNPEKREPDIKSSAMTAKFKEFQEIKTEDSFVESLIKNSYINVSKIHMSQPKIRQSFNPNIGRVEVKDARLENIKLNLSNKDSSFYDLTKNQNQKDRRSPVEKMRQMPNSDAYRSNKEEFWTSKPTHYLGRVKDLKKFDNKENNSYNFSFTDREVSTTQLI